MSRIGSLSVVKLVKQSSSIEWNHIVSLVSNCLKENGIIAIPTDTIYGLAALAQNDTAVEKIYNVKGRKCDKPLAICVADIGDIHKFAKVTVKSIVLDKLLPGPVTLVFERTLGLNPILNPGTSLVGIRIPDYDLIRDVARQCGEPLALTSANISNEPSTLSVEEFRPLWPSLDLVIDGGLLGAGAESRTGSTVIDLSKAGLFTIIRAGSSLKHVLEILRANGLTEERKS